MSEKETDSIQGHIAMIEGRLLKAGIRVSRVAGAMSDQQYMEALQAMGAAMNIL